VLIGARSIIEATYVKFINATYYCSARTRTKSSVITPPYNFLSLLIFTMARYLTYNIGNLVALRYI